MAGMPLLRRYTQLEQWAEALPRTQFALVMGCIWFIVWTITGVFLGQSFLETVPMAGFSALIFGGGHYLWDYR